MTAAVFRQQPVDAVPAPVARRAMAWMDLLDVAVDLQDLPTPGLALRGEGPQRWSIRVDGGWRLRFRWLGGAVEDVELVEVG